MEKIKRKMFVETLPHGGKFLKETDINWEKSIGHKTKFIYDEIEGMVEIKSYKSGILTIIYNNLEFKIRSGAFVKCTLGKLLEKHTSKFKIEIGTKFKDEKRDITIIDREIRTTIYTEKDNKKYNKKWYKYRCNKCGKDGWIEEGHLEDRGCSCNLNLQSPPVLGINTIWDTDPWMIPIVGEECAKTHTHGSGSSVYPICPDCGNKKDKKMTISNIYMKHGVFCFCNDKIPYPEKFMFSVLKQLEMDFKTQLTKVNIKWCNKYKYDFYFEFNGEQYIIETHGMQHYEDVKSWNSSYEKVQKNDKLKKELALTNGIKEENYIVIDCRYSDLEFIKQNILKSNLAKIFDLNKINWIKCGEYACSNLVKKACEIKRDNPDWTTGDIGNIFNMKGQTIRKYLIQGSNIWEWCNYDGFEELKKINKNGKQVEIFKDGISLGVFKSATELERQSIRLFGTELKSSSILDSCNGRKLKYKGYTLVFMNQTEAENMSINERRENLENYFNDMTIKHTPNGKKIICTSNGLIYSSCADCVRKFKELFNIQLSVNCIQKVCNGKQKTHKGYHFKFVSDLTEEEIKEIQLNAK